MKTSYCSLLILTLIAVIIVQLAACAKSDDCWLIKLNTVVAHAGSYQQQKEQQLLALKARLKRSAGLADSYVLCKSIYEAYKTYQTDSAIHYLERCIRYADRMDRQGDANDCYALLALQCSRSGMYTEAREYLDRVDVDRLSMTGKQDYYYASNHLYGELSTFSSIPSKRRQYAALAQQYQDSIFSCFPKMSQVYLMKQTIRLTNDRQYAKALTLNSRWIARSDTAGHEYGVAAYYRYLIYNALHDDAHATYWLVESACNDIKTATMDQASLWTLADNLMNKGYLSYSHHYVTLAWRYAVFFGSRARNWQVSPVLNVIQSDYQQKIQSQNWKLSVIILLLCIFLVVILGLIFYVVRQNKRLHATQDALNEKNRLLEVTVKELETVTDYQRKTLDDLSRTNGQLHESNLMKEEYIAQFLTLCSRYIDQTEKLLKKIYRLTMNNKRGELLALTNNPDWEHEAINALLLQFDAAFLHLFPNFIHDLNQLIAEEYRFDETRLSGKLSTPLRVFALIRLGVTDSKRISDFLHHSVSTIYNYRVKYRNASLIGRDEFENRIKQIGMPAQP